MFRQCLVPLVVTFLLVSASCGMRRSDGPRLELDRNEHRFSPRETGPLRTHFKLSNTGNEALEIQHVVSSCGCMVARVRENNVPPGKSTTLAVEVSRPPIGMRSFMIDVFTNARHNPHARLTLTAQSGNNKSRIVQFVPQTVLLSTDADPPGESWLTAWTLERKEGQFIRGVACDLPFVRVEQSDVRETAALGSQYVQRKYRFRIRAIAGPSTGGTFTGKLTAQTASEHHEGDRHVFLQVTLHGPVRPDPDQLFGTLSAGSSVLPVWTVLLRRYSPTFQCRVISVDTDVPWLNASADSNRLGSVSTKRDEEYGVGEVSVKVTGVPAKFPATGHVRVVVATSSCPELTIPVTLVCADRHSEREKVSGEH